jgi:hypothetical protein
LPGWTTTEGTSLFAASGPAQADTDSRTAVQTNETKVFFNFIKDFPFKLQNELFIFSDGNHHV